MLLPISFLKQIFEIQFPKSCLSEGNHYNLELLQKHLKEKSGAENLIEVQGEDKNEPFEELSDESDQSLLLELSGEDLLEDPHAVSASTSPIETGDTLILEETVTFDEDDGLEEMLLSEVEDVYELDEGLSDEFCEEMLDDTLKDPDFKVSEDKDDSSTESEELLEETVSDTAIDPDGVLDEEFTCDEVQ